MKSVPASKINWQYLDKVGRPSQDLRVTASGALRQFLLRGEYSITCAFMFDDGSGFATEADFTDNIVAWAIVEGF